MALVVTGDELARPGEPLEPGRIYSSNGYVLAALVEQAGAVLTGVASAPDTEEGTRGALAEALEEADVVCVSGGVSVGPHDHVRGAMAELGVEERFWGVRLRPGKPTWFGVRGGTLAFGLPGNPVSATVTFQLFVRPALAALQGADPAARRVTRHPGRGRAAQPAARAGGARAARAPATTGWSRRRPGRRARTS